ncbi:MAG: C39 family peptidase [Proteocatella sp.]
MSKYMIMLSIVLMLQTPYVDQNSTGNYRDYNCLPTAIEMAASIYGLEFNTSKIREGLNHNGGLNLSEMYLYLDESGFGYKLEFIDNKNTIRDYLDDGSLIIAIVDTKNLMSFMNSNEKTKGIYYDNARHCILIKAYSDTEFLVDDPFSMNRKYDGEYIGRNVFIPQDYLIDENFDYLILWVEEKKIQR